MNCGLPYDLSKWIYQGLGNSIKPNTRITTRDLDKALKVRINLKWISKQNGLVNLYGWEGSFNYSWPSKNILLQIYLTRIMNMIYWCSWVRFLCIILNTLHVWWGNSVGQDIVHAMNIDWFCWNYIRNLLWFNALKSFVCHVVL